MDTITQINTYLNAVSLSIPQLPQRKTFRPNRIGIHSSKYKGVNTIYISYLSDIKKNNDVYTSGLLAYTQTTGNTKHIETALRAFINKHHKSLLTIKDFRALNTIGQQAINPDYRLITK